MNKKIIQNIKYKAQFVRYKPMPIIQNVMWYLSFLGLSKRFSYCLFIFSFMLNTVNVFAQTSMWNNDSSKTHIQSGTIIVIPGNLINLHSGTFNNSGAINLHGNWFNNSGNATFTNSSPGTVFLLGDTQIIGGINPTLFYNLNLQGTGVKKLNINSMAEGKLSLNDRELNTQNYSMSVLSADTSAIMRTTGYVSSTGSGCLARVTNTSLPYLFPVGSSFGTFRYRPVTITPTSVNLNMFSVRMANVDASAEGFDLGVTDGIVSDINNKFFHRINRTLGADGAKICIYYDNATDSIFSGLSHWQNTPDRWEDVGTVTAVYNTSPAFSSLSVSNWYDFTGEPFALYGSSCVPSSVPVSLTVNPASGCVGEPHTLQVQGGLLGTGASWYWFEGGCGDTLLGITASDSISIFPVGTITYFVRAEGACGITPCVSILVKPSPLAPVSIGISASDTIICNGSLVSFSALYANGGMNPFFQWYLNGNPVGADSSEYNLTNLNNDDTVYCILISSAECVTGNPATSGTIVMSVNPTYIISGIVGICEGNFYNFGDTILTTAGIYTHTFASVKGCDSIITLTLNVNQAYVIPSAVEICQGDSIFLNGSWQLTSGNYSDSLHTIYGCDSIITTNLTVTPALLVSVVISATDTIICAGTNDSIMISGTNGGTSPAYQWFINGLFAGSGNFLSQNSFSDSDSIFCIMTSSLTSCVTNNPATSNNVSLKVNPMPVIFINKTNESCLGANDGSIDLSVSDGTPPYSYIWSSGQTIEDINSLVSETYSVQVTDGNSCISQGSCEIAAASATCIYVPNIFSPNGDGKNDKLYVRGGGIRYLEFSIYDRWGNKVFETNDQNIGWDGCYKDSPMNAAVFVYYVKVEIITGNTIEVKGNVTLVR
ncbi:MAG TPA: hypothetical protein DEH02_09720 [Bacteroidales bacterium]|nr:hypothetical protein [Bacteroidales bacterium]